MPNIPFPTLDDRGPPYVAPEEHEAFLLIHDRLKTHLAEAQAAAQVSMVIPAEVIMTYLALNQKLRAQASWLVRYLQRGQRVSQN